MSSAPKYIPNYTVSDYLRWDGDWELWNGFPIAMTPSPFGKHGELLVRAAAAMQLALEEASCPATALAEVDWVVSEDTVVRPDLSLVCGDAPKEYIQSPPALVIEILSPTTRERDLTVKRELYEQKGVLWFLVIDPDNSAMTAWRLDDSGSYHDVATQPDLVIDVCAQCRLTVPAKRIFP